MHRFLSATAILSVLTLPALADGDIAAGEKIFKKCKSCHMIAPPDGDPIVKGGKTGPNLYGVIGRTAGSVEGARYSKALKAAGEAGLVWDVENLAAFVTDPKAFLQEVSGDSSARSNMTFKLKTGGEEVAAYLLSVGPAPEPEMMEGEAEEATETQ